MYRKAKSFTDALKSKPYLFGLGAENALGPEMIEEADFDFVCSGSLCISA